MGRLSSVGIPRAGLGATLIGAALAAAAVAGPRAAVAVSLTGSIAGVTTTNEAAPRPIRVTIDPAVCGESLPDEAIAVDAGGRLANVVVSLPGMKAPAPADVVVTNDRCRFVPRVSVMKPGGTIKMLSKDATMHTMHAAAPDARALFNVSIPLPNVTIARVVARPGLLALTCSTHTWMRGYMQVTDEATAISGPDGAFRLDGVPAGTHELKIWHETLKVASPVKVTVKEGGTTNVNVTLAR
jgi:plastocyanin